MDDSTQKSNVFLILLGGGSVFTFFCSSEHGPFLSFQKPAGKGNVLQVLREKHGSEQSTRSSSMTKKNKTTARFLSQPTQFPFTDQELSGGDTEFLGGSGSKWVRESHFSVSVCSPHRLWNRLVGLKLPFWLQRRRLWNQKSAPFVLLVQPCR